MYRQTRQYLTTSASVNYVVMFSILYNVLESGVKEDYNSMQGNMPI